MNYVLSVAAVILLAVTSCKKESNTPPVPPPVEQKPVTSELSLEFDNRIKDQDLHLGVETYTTEIYAEQFTVTTLKYFISNVTVTNTGDTVYTVPQDSSYFLVDESNFNSTFAKMQVPVGDYKSLSFVLGVDSMRNTMDISKRTGVLDPATGANGMYWDLNSGYIFFNVEGTSPSSPEVGNVFMYHIGGYGGSSSPTINNLKTITLDLQDRGIAEIREGNKSNIHIMVDISKVFDSRGQPVRIANHPVVMLDDFSTNISYNTALMFRHDHTEN
jgi:hypothetical protein